MKYSELAYFWLASDCRFDWKLHQMGIDEKVGWDLWEHSSYLYFRVGSQGFHTLGNHVWSSTWLFISNTTPNMKVRDTLD